MTKQAKLPTDVNSRAKGIVDVATDHTHAINLHFMRYNFCRPT
jgi:hypothetical protein